MPKKTTILLADEQTLFRESLIALCEAAREFRVVGHCGDGNSAVRMIHALDPDMAILDLGLPRLFALEVIRKARLAESRCRFIILSSRRDHKTVVEVLRAGANGYVLRTDPAASLLRAVREILAGCIYVSPQFELAKVFRGAAVAPPRESYEELSPREYQVFTLLVEGLRGKDIAGRLDISQKTVSTYRTNLMLKLNIHDIAGLVRYAVRKRLVPLR
ncbi:MAG: response regulator transcription factor [Planctomycetota bacterium]